MGAAMIFEIFVRPCNYGLGVCVKCVENRFLAWGRIIVDRDAIVAFVMLDDDGGRQ